MGAHAEERSMNEYAFFIWGSYGVAALCIALEIYFLSKK
jgi:heme exporter protein D